MGILASNVDTTDWSISPTAGIRRSYW